MFRRLATYGWYEMYYGETLTLIAKAYEEVDGEEAGVEGVSYSWKLKDPVNAAIIIQPAGDRCKITANTFD